MGPTALLPLWRKACCGFFRPKNPVASARCEPANLGTKGQHAASRPPKPLTVPIIYDWIICSVLELLLTWIFLVRLQRHIYICIFSGPKRYGLCGSGAWGGCSSASDLSNGGDCRVLNAAYFRIFRLWNRLHTNIMNYPVLVGWCSPGGQFWTGNVVHATRTGANSYGHDSCGITE